MNNINNIVLQDTRSTEIRYLSISHRRNFRAGILLPNDRALEKTPADSRRDTPANI